ncbi:MAG: hypothetical protein WBP03_04475 [Candidatus Saccharimonadales bacterium]|jgi:hypothetical protein
MEDQLTQLVAKLKSSQNVLVTVSKSPSVDQLSAAIGLTLALNKLQKHATAVFSGQVPSTIEFLKPEETLEPTTDSLRDFIIALDKSKADKLRYRVEDEVVRIFITPYHSAITEQDLDYSQGDFNVDVIVALGVHEQQDLDDAIQAHGRILHDATLTTVDIEGQSDMGAINVVNTSASSLSEIITNVVGQLDTSVFDSQIATALLTGIVAMTERFSNGRTTPETMKASATLMSAGADQQLVANELEPPAPEQPEQPAEPEQSDASEPEQSEDNSEQTEPEQTVPVEPGTLEIQHDSSDLQKAYHDHKKKREASAEYELFDDEDEPSYDTSPKTESLDTPADTFMAYEDGPYEDVYDEQYETADGDQMLPPISASDADVSADDAQQDSTSQQTYDDQAQQKTGPEPYDETLETREDEPADAAPEAPNSMAETIITPSPEKPAEVEPDFEFPKIQLHPNEKPALSTQDEMLPSADTTTDFPAGKSSEETGLPETSGVRERMVMPPSRDSMLTANTETETLDKPVEALSQPSADMPLLSREAPTLAPTSAAVAEPFVGAGASMSTPFPPAPPVAPPTPAFAPPVSSPPPFTVPDFSLDAPSAPPETGGSNGPDTVIDSNETLTEIEKEVGSAHVGQAFDAETPNTTLDSARNAVDAALKATPAGPPQDPIAALNAQPFGGPLHAPDDANVAQPSGPSGFQPAPNSGQANDTGVNMAFNPAAFPTTDPSLPNPLANQQNGALPPPPPVPPPPVFPAA